MIFGLGGLFIFSKISQLKWPSPGDILKRPEGRPPDPRTPSFDFAKVDYDAWIRADGVMNVAWQVYHSGPPGTYWASAIILDAAQHYLEGERGEQPFQVEQDDTRRIYTVTKQFWWNVAALGAMQNKIRFFIADANNQRLAVDDSQWGFVIVRP